MTECSVPATIAAVVLILAFLWTLVFLFVMLQVKRFIDSEGDKDDLLE